MVHFIEVQAENSMIFSGEHWRAPTIALFVCCQRAVFLHGEKNFPVVIEKEHLNALPVLIQTPRAPLHHPPNDFDDGAMSDLFGDIS
jgi:hypothetical protein